MKTNYFVPFRITLEALIGMCTICVLAIVMSTGSVLAGGDPDDSDDDNDNNSGGGFFTELFTGRDANGDGKDIFGNDRDDNGFSAANRTFGSGGYAGGSSSSSGSSAPGPAVNDPTWGRLEVTSGQPNGFAVYDTRTINGRTYTTYFDPSVGRSAGPTAASLANGSSNDNSDNSSTNTSSGGSTSSGSAPASSGTPTSSGSSGTPASSGATSSGAPASSGSSGVPVPTPPPPPLNVDVHVCLTDGSGNCFYGDGPHEFWYYFENNFDVVWNVQNSQGGLTCDGSDDFTSMSNRTAPGSQAPSVSEQPNPGGSTVTYTVSCTDERGGDPGNASTDSITVYIPPAAQNLEMNVRLDTDSPTPPPPTQPFVVRPSDPSSDIYIGWESEFATLGCSAWVGVQSGTAAGNFQADSASREWSSVGQSCVAPHTGNPNACMDISITEPDPGHYAFYSMLCSSMGGNTDTEDILVVRPAPTPRFMVYTDPALTIPATLVDIGDTVYLDWDLNGNHLDDCGISGSNYNGPTPWTERGTAAVTIQGESEFTLSCSDQAQNVVGESGDSFTFTVNEDHTISRQVNVTSNFIES